MSKPPVLIFAGPVYEDLELWYPKLRLEEAGYTVKVAGLGEPEYKGKHGYPLKVDGTCADFAKTELSGVVVPGGFAPDKIRQDEAALAIVRRLDEQKRLVAAICHAGWVLVSAKILRGRKVTSVKAIRDDLVNAGAEWVDQPVVTDGNLVTSRRPEDLPVFMRAVLEVLAR
jgi:protease I